MDTTVRKAFKVCPCGKLSPGGISKVYSRGKSSPGGTSWGNRGVYPCGKCRKPSSRGTSKVYPCGKSSHGGTGTSFARAEVSRKHTPYGVYPCGSLESTPVWCVPVQKKLRCTVRVSDRVGRFPQGCVKAATVLSFLI